MNKDLINKYGINFRNKVINGRINKIPVTDFGPLTFLLIEWNAADIVDEVHGLLTDIDAALADPSSEIEAGSTMVTIIIYHKIVQFYFDDGAEVSTMPTIDLREIVVGWRDFLLKPPLSS